MAKENPGAAATASEADFNTSVCSNNTASAALLSIITAERPARISKAFRLVGGRLDKQPGGNMTRGKVEVRAIGGLDDLATILASLTPAQAMTYGIPPEGASRKRDGRALIISTSAPDDANSFSRWLDEPPPGTFVQEHRPAFGLPADDLDSLLEAKPAS